MKEYIKPEILVHILSNDLILIGTSEEEYDPTKAQLSKQSSFSFEDEELDEDY